VLISPLGLGTEIAQSFLEGVLDARTPQAMGRELSRLTVEGARPSAAYLDALCRRMQAGATGWRRLVDSVALHGVQQMDIRPDLKALASPVSLVHGRADAIIPWQHALQAPPAVGVHLVPGAGHMPQWEAPDLVQTVILRAAAVGGALMEKLS
jgi:pyruvate dehydrogenase E2 component (dihydrolipoamide acetyltransferase)